ncbi:PAS and ANTAR domain-containing protein [Mycolicibacterium sp. 018/SC-01/001]|uniref:PAS and ANTAR domain-containing protein n=1 Tax=Mycolicibacterium sp. 018/SC-01/001 TaxID=2592069 RepID=UPI002104B513|nr:PAS and ANTAR domain-containing protein [Mycolicibacterium sp. 018/SC-01/001]
MLVVGEEETQRVGWFAFHFDDERWEWSDEVQTMHGYEPGTVTPTTDLVLSHKHPDDRPTVAATLHEMRRAHRPFSTRHRIVDTRGDVRDVVVVGDRMTDEQGRVIGTHGFYVDVTPAPPMTQEMVTAALSEITENRAVIEQVKGMLMLIYRVDGDAAFELLRWRSQESNVKLRALAEQLLADYQQLVYQDTLPDRETFDHLLLTAHQRVGSNGDTVNP